MDRIRRESPTSLNLLNLCAYLGPDDIPKELLNERGKCIQVFPSSTARSYLRNLFWLFRRTDASERTEVFEMDKAIRALRQYSLVEVSRDALSVHRLVQLVVRDRLAEQDRRLWSANALRLVNDAFPFKPDDVQTWSKSTRLLPHALAAAGHTEELQVASEATGRLLNQVALYLRARAEFDDAKKALERALTIDQKVYGPNHPTVAVRLNNLGLLLQNQGDLAEARAHIERALAIDQAVYGPKHPTVATDLNNLGRIFQEQGDLVGVREYIERALAIDQEVYGPNHPEVAIRLNNLGRILREQGDLVGAHEHVKRAVQIFRESLGENHQYMVQVQKYLDTFNP